MQTVDLEKVSYSGIEELRIDASLFDVDIAGKPGDTVEMTVRMPRELTERYEVRHAKEGAALVVQVVRKKIGLLGFHGELRIVLVVPRETVLDIVSSSGNQTVEGIESKSVVLRSSSGDIKAQSIAAGFKAAASSGRLELDAITGSMAIRTSSGDIRLHGANGDLAVETSSGRINVQDLRGNIEGHASSGDHTYAAVVGDLAAGTSTGKISIDGLEGKLSLRSSSGDLLGKSVALTGDSTFRTSSGRIDFQLENDTGLLSFELVSSSGDLSAAGTRAEKRLTAGYGPIKVRGQSSSGDQTFR
jgi:DUF4097 and DUF4098 domain-containing protein YvlB